MHLSMASFNKNSEGLFCGLGPGLNARNELWTKKSKKTPVLGVLCSGVQTMGRL